MKSDGCSRRFSKMRYQIPCRTLNGVEVGMGIQHNVLQMISSEWLAVAERSARLSDGERRPAMAGGESAGSDGGRAGAAGPHRALGALCQHSSSADPRGSAVLGGVGKLNVDRSVSKLLLEDCSWNGKVGDAG